MKNHFNKGFVIPLLIALAVLLIVGGVYLNSRKEPASEFDVLPYSEVTIVVPNDIAAYEKAMNEYVSNGGTNPSLTWPFVEKKVSIATTTDVIPAMIEAAANQISTQGTNLVYLKGDGDVTYVQLGMDVDAWAGVSFAIAKTHPVVEKTLLNIPGIREVQFKRAPGDVVGSPMIQPSITVLSSNGGETWAVGTKQSVVVDVKGNPKELGSFIEVWLATDDIHDMIATFTSCYLGGIHTIDFTIPSRIKVGKYKVYVSSESNKLLIIPPCARGEGNSKPLPIVELNDYSDNFINITN